MLRVRDYIGSSIATAMPGKIGDAIYSLPTIRKIYRDTGEKIDFFTSQYCAPMQRLFEYQDCIGSFHVAHDYVVDNEGCGFQPPEVPISGDYEKIYQFGFKQTPDRSLHEYIWYQTFGEDVKLDVEYQSPEIEKPYFNGDFLVISSKGFSSFHPIFLNIMKQVECVIVGAPNEWIGGKAWNELGTDMLETVSIMKRAKGYVGIFSSMLVLANGCDIPRVCIHQGFNDMKHAIYTDKNHYMNLPTAQQVLDIIYKG